MNQLTHRYPGDAFLCATVSILWVIAALVTAAGVGEWLVGRGRAALRSALWRSALVGVLLAPAFVAFGPRPQWQFIVFLCKRRK